ncbi:hypothetical protein [Paraburkholderia sp.]|uniref:hypothetical protein n=1 Tax=Paraburkholderia sp. TaxID=1926495 RepID=UPI003C7BA7DF
MPPPWESCDGHGPVSDGTTREKRPGEWVLSRYRGLKRHYDAAEANRIAKRDGWGLGEEHRSSLIDRLTRPHLRRTTPDNDQRLADRDTGRAPLKALTAGEVRRDFEYLRRWCNNLWHYCGIVVTSLGDSPPPPTDYSYALWGIEDDGYDQHESVAFELMSEAANRMHREYLESRHWFARDHMTV